jgi:hypothetical protein
MKIFLSRVFLIFVALILFGSTCFANMKKGSVGDGGQKTFVFSTSQDGPCSVTVIYDSNTADIDTGIGSVDSGDAVCFGISTQKNFDACTAGLPPGDYFIGVSSFKGSSNFRTVVNCGSDERIAAGREAAPGVTLREFDGNSKSRKFMDQITKVADGKK